MYVIILVLLFLPIIACKPELSGSYYISIAPEAYFVQYIIFTEGEIATSCNLDYTNEDKENVSISIDLNNEVLVVDKQFGGRITTLGNGICGIKGYDFTKNDPESLTFVFKYKTKAGELKNESLFFYVKIYNLNLNDITTESVLLGSSKTIKCGLINTVINCKIYNPQGILVFNGVKCKYDIAVLTIENIGKWKCVSSTLKNMEPYVEVVEYILADNGVDTWYKEEDGYGLIGCKYSFISPVTKRIIIPKYCQFLRPDNLIFTVMPSNGGISERYTYLGTNLDNFQCQIEFKLPRITTEEGRWKCLIEETGGFINVGHNVFSVEPKIEKSLILKAELGQPLKLYCNVPYAADNCYIMSPSKEMHDGGTLVNFWKGECVYSISYIKESDFGQWSCHFSNPNDALDDIIIIEVEEYKTVRSEPSRILVDVEKPTNLMCRTEAPIFYCRFVDPNGKNYHISEDKSADNIVYSGKGLGYGECGISIKNITRDQIGMWNCSIRTRNGNSEGDVEASASTMMYIRDEGIGTAASTIGIPIGIAVVAILILIFAFYRGYKKRSNEPNNRRDSRTSASSNTAFNIPMENIPHYSADRD